MIMSKAKTTDSDSDVPQTYNDLQELSRGDCVIINDTKYYVVNQNTGLRSLFSPDFPTVIGSMGESKDLTFGTIENSNACGVIWLKDVTGNMSESDLLASYDQVTIQKGEPQNAYDCLKHTSKDVCPHCGYDVSQFKDGERNGTTTRELLRCNDSDNCGNYFVRERELPKNDSATATVQTFNDETKEIELSGCYRQIISSRFKLDPRQRAKEKWVTATEVANELEAKTTGETTHGRVQHPNNEIGDSIVWKDEQYSHKMKIMYRKVTFE